MLTLLPDTPEDLATAFRQMGLPTYRARQVLRWYYRGAREFEEMTDLPLPLRTDLSARWRLHATRCTETHRSRDGAFKLLLELDDGCRIETVGIPSGSAAGEEGPRATICLSTQVGCPVGCPFCASGRATFVRSLAAREIVEQVLLARRTMSDGGNILFMGMGEPLRNLTEVLMAITRIHSDWGLGVGMNRITLSTVGFPEPLERLARSRNRPHLAISLHAVDDAMRARLVPRSGFRGVQDVVAAALAYGRVTRRRVTFEYCLLAGINDSSKEAARLARLVAGSEALVNLLPFNDVPGTGFRAPEPAEARRFLAVLERAGIRASLRRRRGADVNAACGQLAGRPARESPAAGPKKDDAPRRKPKGVGKSTSRNGSPSRPSGRRRRRRPADASPRRPRTTNRRGPRSP